MRHNSSEESRWLALLNTANTAAIFQQTGVETCWLHCCCAIVFKTLGWKPWNGIFLLAILHITTSGSETFLTDWGIGYTLVVWLLKEMCLVLSGASHLRWDRPTHWKRINSYLIHASVAKGQGCCQLSSAAFPANLIARQLRVTQAHISPLTGCKTQKRLNFDWPACLSLWWSILLLLV